MADDDYSWVDSPLEKEEAETPAPAPKKRREASQQARARYNQYAKRETAAGRTPISYQRWLEIHGD